MRILTLFLILIPNFLSAQNLDGCGNCAWSSAAFQQVWQRYTMGDTTNARARVLAVRIMVTSDTTSPGMSMSNMNTPNCSGCRIVRYDKLGREEIIFDNNANLSNGQLIKIQYVYNDDNTPKYILHYAKDPASEYDTAYHMTSYELVAYYDKFSITKCYRSNGTDFSAAPKADPLYILTKTFDAKGRILMMKTKYPANSEYNDSAVFIYPDLHTKITRQYAGKTLVSTRTEITDGNFTTQVYDSVYVQPAGSTSAFSYDDNHRIVQTTTRGTGQTQKYCGGVDGSAAEVRYNEFGLPVLIIYRGNGQLCALEFFYTYSQ
jgi:YD repeat-containing protein